MTLQIKIIKAPHSASLPQNNHIFDESGGSIGRGPGNTWILPDPERILSSRHCEFVFEAGCYHLIDLSTNGTFINGSPEPLGKGARAQLVHGDSVEIGDYCFSVAMEGERQENILSTEDESLAMESPFASGSDLSGSPFGNNYLNDQPALSLNADGDNVDPLQALDQASGSDVGGPLFGEQPAEAAPDFLFSPASNQVAGESLGSDAVAWPDAVAEHVIPDDWDLDEDLGLTPSHNSWPEEAAPVSAEFSVPAAMPFEPANAPQQDVMAQPAQHTPDLPPAQSAPGLHVPVPPARGVTPVPPPEPVPQPTSPPQQEAPLVQAPVQQPMSQTNGNGQAQSAKQGDALIAAMGLDSSQFDQARRNELHTLVGSLMRDVVEGLMQAMRARASIKNEFRMNVTTIQPVENNPLKFSADVNEAMENIFVRQSNAYKAPAEAVQEGFQEIAGHQMAMIAGMREAFEEMLKGFDPSMLEQSFQRQQKPGPIAALQNGRYWRQYQAHYEGLTDNMERSFQQIFGDVFVQAYEDQLRRLAATRKL